jgi:hypothetical protein
LGFLALFGGRPKKAVFWPKMRVFTDTPLVETAHFQQKMTLFQRRSKTFFLTFLSFLKAFCCLCLFTKTTLQQTSEELFEFFTCFIILSSPRTLRSSPPNQGFDQELETGRKEKVMFLILGYNSL